MIRITSNRHNFRRCGMRHPKQATDYPDDRFSDEELAILRTEPMLTVQEIPDPSPELEMEPALEAEAQVIAATIEQRPDPPPEDKGRLPPIDDPDADLIAAAKMAVDAGDTISSGAPTVSAMEAILGRNISAADRNRAWEKLQADDDGLLAVTPPLEEMDEPALKKLLDRLNITYETDTPKGELILLVERNTAEVSAGE